MLLARLDVRYTKIDVVNLMNHDAHAMDKETILDRYDYIMH